MKSKQYAALLILLLILPLFLSCSLKVAVVSAQTPPSLYFGVDVAYGNITATEQLIDNVSSYSNFFVIGCTGNYNQTTLTIISQYAYDKGLTFIVYSDRPNYPSSQWLEDAKNNWGNSFLGIYYLDEEGGKQLDQAEYPIVPESSVTEAANYSYSDAAESYVNTLNRLLRSGSFAVTNNFAYPTEFQLFTSDYAFYWYDYEAGYNTVFDEFGYRTGWANDSQQLNMALCRGAATVQNKDWGVMITWAYDQPPYMEPGPELYNDMVLAYENGAKYIVIFDSNTNYTQNVLVQGQLDAMKQFWQYAQANPRTITPVSERTAYVLPADYAYGFGGPDDKIWGLWNADSLTVDIGMSVVTLLQMDGKNLDMVYPDGPQTIESAGYGSVIYWNNTILIPTPTPSPSPSQGTSLPFYAADIYLYAITAGILIAVAVIVIKFKRTGLSRYYTTW
jgi:hypothetical protein